MRSPKGPREDRRNPTTAPRESQEGSKRLPIRAKGPPWRSPWGVRKRWKTIGCCSIRGLDANEGGTWQRNQQYEEQEGLCVPLPDRCPAARAPRGPHVGPKGFLGGSLGGSEDVEKPLFFERLVAWKQVKVARGSKTNKKSNMRAKRGL